MKRQLAILFLLVTSIIASYGQTEKRLALVVGNSKYIGKGNSLRNPVNDATDVAIKLKALGFDVDTLLDASLLEMDDAIDDFGMKAKEYDVALFYYSGHGLQSKGNNYMVPVDAELKSETEVKYKCTPLNMLLDKMDESDCPLKIIVLDACRDNPLTKSWYRGGAEKGLALMNPPRGTFITFATAAGSVALDGKDRNSPYTTAFLKTLDRPNLDLDKFFSEVGKLVLKETNNEQVPWKSASAMSGDDFYFNRKSDSDAISEPAHSINSHNGHEYVDLGLPSGTLWATCNVGATVPEGYGDHLAWGETSPKSSYMESNYKYCKKDDSGYYDYTKYVVYDDFFEDYFYDNLTVLELSDDAANVNWGNGWQTPTKSQWEELIQNTNISWTTLHGINGLFFTATNGNSIFLPAAGDKWEDKSCYSCGYGSYWSNSLDIDNDQDAESFFFDERNSDIHPISRVYGRSVRPVCKK